MKNQIKNTILIIHIYNRNIKIHLQTYRNKINKLRIKKIMMINLKFNKKQIKIALFKKSQNRRIVKKVL